MQVDGKHKVNWEQRLKRLMWICAIVVFVGWTIFGIVVTVVEQDEYPDAKSGAAVVVTVILGILSAAIVCGVFYLLIAVISGVGWLRRTPYAQQIVKPGVDKSISPTDEHKAK